MRFIEFKQSETSPTKYRLELNIKEAEEVMAGTRETFKYAQVQGSAGKTQVKASALQISKKKTELQEMSSQEKVNKCY